jgi:hypothetical protein
MFLGQSLRVLRKTTAIGDAPSPMRGGGKTNFLFRLPSGEAPPLLTGEGAKTGWNKTAKELDAKEDEARWPKGAG